MAVIKAIKAREILDSRGNPTVEARLDASNGSFYAKVPSGASTGVHEALELRDGGHRFGGLGVLKAVKNITKIEKQLKGKAINQVLNDKAMLSLDGTTNKKKLGANAILPVSMCISRAKAAEHHLELYAFLNTLTTRKMSIPVPSFNVINGGKHAGNGLDFQEYMIMPVGAKTFAEAFQIGAETYHALKKIIEKKYGKEAINVGDEGGFAPPLNDYEEPLRLLKEAAQQAGHWKKIAFAMDVAASEFFHKGKYVLEGKARDTTFMISLYKDLVKRYPIFSIEDPFDQDDFESWVKLKKEIGQKVQLVGDDLLVTNVARIQGAENACNALLLKINQIGSISEALEAAKLAHSLGWKVMVSHRSGETEDTFIADLAVALGSGQIKSGAPCRGERVAKYNRLLEIEQQSKIKYARL